LHEDSEEEKMISREFGNTGVQVPVIGQGTWEIGDSRSRADQEIRSLRAGIDLGLSHIDTAEMYGNGRSEELVGRAISDIRHRVFLTSKVLPSNASYAGTLRACEQSLRRLGTDYLDLYLLHWWSEAHPIEDTMAAMEELVRAGKVRFIGVSNLENDEMRRAEDALAHEKIACNQVCYHLQARGIEFSVTNYCTSRGIAVVGYSPFGSGKFPGEGSREWQTLADIGRRHGKTPRQVALNFLTRREGLFSIPKAANADHVRENAGAVGWDLTVEDLQAIDDAFPPPTADSPLEMI
jgi:diketogulonate reductase-like aldo/keto reductase